ncbi:hypothetical protein BVI434_410109 [Burkholderia vietnamiensis]|nr:hypothetical protein BVI434_410109 [Burkholderia vietnamiensis]
MQSAALGDDCKLVSLVATLSGRCIS